MADRCQAVQRNIYHNPAENYKVDGKKSYGMDYMRRLAFIPSDLPTQARKVPLPVLALASLSSCAMYRAANFQTPTIRSTLTHTLSAIWAGLVGRSVLGAGLRGSIHTTTMSLDSG